MLNGGLERWSTNSPRAFVYKQIDEIFKYVTNSVKKNHSGWYLNSPYHNKDMNNILSSQLDKKKHTTHITYASLWFELIFDKQTDNFNSTDLEIGAYLSFNPLIAQMIILITSFDGRMTMN